MHNILISSAGRRVSLLRAFRKELKQTFPKARVLAADCSPELSPACQEADACFLFPRNDSPDFIPQLLELCATQKVGLLIPTIDTELVLLAKHRDDFFSVGTHVIVPKLELVKTCRDKRLTNQFFLERDIPAPETYDRCNLKFPTFVKPIDGSCSKNTFLVTSAAEMEAVECQVGNTVDLIYQQAIPRETYEEYTVDLYYDRHCSLKCVVPRKRLETRAGEVSKGLTLKNEIIPFLRQRLATIDGAIGCLTLQLFKHCRENSYFGIEINPRFGGGYPLSYRAGANYPAWLIAEYFKGADISYTDDWEENLLFLRYDDEVLVHGFKG